MKVLGIETSCDETAAAVVELTDQHGARLLSNTVASSMELHIQYGGVVPEIAARSHIEVIIPVIEQALAEAKTDWDQVDAVAVTYGPGLGGSLLIGVTTARTLAIAHNKPLYAINHVEAHAYVNFITSTSLPGYTLPSEPPAFPMLALLVSGKHSEHVLFRSHFDYDLLGETQDDAIGEAFDKVAKMLGLPYPGGPSIAKKALDGDPLRYQLPKAHLSPHIRVHESDAAQGSSENRKGAVHGSTATAAQSDNAAMRAIVDSGKYDFSFSGLKTAVLRLAQAEIGESFAFPSKDLPGRLTERQKADIAASFQRIAIETLVDKTVTAYQEFGPKSIVIGGGVAASLELRRQLSERLPRPVHYPDFKLCTDNGAMIACLGSFKASGGQPTTDPYALDIDPSLSM